MHSDYETIVLNTSLGWGGLKRDAIYLKIICFLNKKSIVFFRGLDDAIISDLQNNRLSWFQKNFFNANIFVVLSNSFKSKLINWGYKKPIFVESTVVDDNLLRKGNKDFSNLVFLFFSRIEKYKGIYETINAVNNLEKRGYNFEFKVVGTGTELENVKKIVNQLKIKNIKFYGYVIDEEKKAILNDSNILLFPSYSEGMPNSVLECMAQGLVIVTTKVGGLVDFFKDKINGYFLEELSTKEIESKIESLFKDLNILHNISRNNILYASNNFIASNVVKRLIYIFNY